MTLSKLPLSGSTNGRAIKVAATADPGTVIHTASSSGFDEIWLYAVNTSGSNVALTIEWGGNSSPDDLITATIVGQSGVNLIIPGFILQNSLVVKAYATTVNVITIIGFINRVS